MRSVVIHANRSRCPVTNTVAHGAFHDRELRGDAAIAERVAARKLPGMIGGKGRHGERKGRKRLFFAPITRSGLKYRLILVMTEEDVPT